MHLRCSFHSPGRLRSSGLTAMKSVVICRARRRPGKAHAVRRTGEGQAGRRPGKGMDAAMALLLSCPSLGSGRHARCPGRELRGLLSVFLCACTYCLTRFLESTSITTASKSTMPLTVRCQLASIPRMDMPLLSTPMNMAPITAPPTVPTPP